MRGFAGDFGVRRLALSDFREGLDAAFADETMASVTMRS
jgi:hypothetical protein